jgi:hypothetical protein
MTHGWLKRTCTLSLHLLALSGFVYTPALARADPYTLDALFTSPVLNYGARPGELEVLSNVPNLVGLRSGPDRPGPGTLRFVLWPGLEGETNSRGLYEIQVKGFALNTDLKLTPDQFFLPAGWTATPNAVVPGLGRFSWVLSTPAADPRNSSQYTWFDIGGLGANATFNHFVLPASPAGTSSSSAWFAADIVPFYFPDTFGGQVPAITDFWASSSLSSVAQTPEPSTFVLASLGMLALLGRCVLRRGNTSETLRSNAS